MVKHLYAIVYKYYLTFFFCLLLSELMCVYILIVSDGHLPVYFILFRSVKNIHFILCEIPLQPWSTRFNFAEEQVQTLTKKKEQIRARERETDRHTRAWRTHADIFVYNRQMVKCMSNPSKIQIGIDLVAVKISEWFIGCVTMPLTIVIFSYII